MLRRNVQQIKDSHLVTIPAHLCALMGIEKGTVMDIELNENKIVMTPVTSTRQDQKVTGVQTHPKRSANE
ncbi:AbrB/MazE/SpoVT family DNA-binding domain-containing protein [Methanolobus sp. ZRKC4]|uniref:AbrB/MazE/SpoVT family DNA-binding domain-containing protein n=1 Tax=Methanolobus sp. ZRKC4 TaxID=3125787 RepID=UPI00325260E5